MVNINSVNLVKALVSLVYLWVIVWNVWMILIEKTTQVVLVKKAISKTKKWYVKVA